MTQYSRLCIAAVLLSCLAAPAFGASGALDARVRQAVKSATLDANEHATDAAFARAVGAESLQALALGEGPEAAALTVRLSGIPACNTFGLDSGRRVVIDLRNTVNLHDGAQLAAEGAGLIRSVRTSIFSTDPEFVSRIVLDMDRPCSFSVENLEDRILIRVSEKDHNGAGIFAGGFAGEEALVELLVEAPTTATPPAPAAPVLPGADRVNELASQLASLFESAPAPKKAVAPVRVEAPKPVGQTRLTRLVSELSEVADAELDLSLDYGIRDAAPQDDADTAEEVEDAPAEADTATPPPGPRPERTPMDAEANRSFTSVLRSLRTGNTPDEIANVDADPSVSDFETFAVGAEASTPQVMMDTPGRAYTGDPLFQPVDLDLRDAELSHVVAMLANQAGVNVMGGNELTGLVTIELRNVPLKQAMETTLSLNDLGLINKLGIYYIVSYDEAMLSQRRTTMVELQNAKAPELQAVIEAILQGDQDFKYISVASHEAANTLVLRAPESRLEELVNLANDLDVTEVLPPMVTATIPVNWASPTDLLPLVQTALTKSEEMNGAAAADPRGRSIIVTDQPVIIEQIRTLIADLDDPVKQVYIDAMIVDAVLQDAAETGVDWLISAVRSQSRRDAALGNGRAIGNLQNLSLGSEASLGEKAGMLAFNVLSADIDWSGVVQAEVRNDDSRLVSRPQLLTQENKPATITISQEIPYVELTETAAGGSQTSTSFKDIGTIMEVTPRVTHDDHIMVQLSVKESDTGAVFNNIPIENKREISTSSMVASGRTLLVGGLRRNNNDASVRKVPVLGDVPVLNFLFRSNVRSESINELLVFLTCHVLSDEPALTDYQTEKFDYGMSQDLELNTQTEVIDSIIHPNKMRKPVWRSGDGDEDDDEDDDN